MLELEGTYPMSINVFKPLYSEHRKLLADLDSMDESRLPTPFIEYIEDYIATAVANSCLIGYVEQREHLRSFLHFWALIVYRNKGYYPNVILKPFDGELKSLN